MGRHFSDSSRSGNWRQAYYRRKGETNEAMEKDTYAQVSLNSPPRKIAKSESTHHSIQAGGHFAIMESLQSPSYSERAFYFFFSNVNSKGSNHYYCLARCPDLLGVPWSTTPYHIPVNGFSQNQAKPGVSLVFLILPDGSPYFSVSIQTCAASGSPFSLPSSHLGKWNRAIKYQSSIMAPL